ncbi:SDR family NAD(P)-dependent oxidoreductase [Dermacoccaceae bacterium W4C1]
MTTTAMVTGASAGIGTIFCEQLAARGSNLIVVARNAERLEALAARLTAEHGISVEVLPADLSDRAQVGVVAERLADATRPVDMLVNNAGYGLRKAFLKNEVAEEEQMLAVLVTAPVVLSHAAAGAMQERGNGIIVNVASVAAFLTSGTYSAAKAYLKTFSQSLSSELAGTGVRVTVLCPGFTRTEFHERAGIRGHGIPDALWLDANKLVTDALADIDKGKTLSVPGYQYKAIVPLLRLVPSSLLGNPHLVSRHRPGK